MKRPMESLRFASASALATMTRMVWPRTSVASVARATTPIFPSSISFRPNGGGGPRILTRIGRTRRLGPDDAHRRPLGIGRDRAERADGQPQIDAAGDDRLQRLARAGRIDHLELEAVLLEDAGLGTELGNRGVPVAALPDGDL